MFISCRMDYPWPAHSPDLSPLDYFLSGYFKDRVYVNNSQTIAALKNNFWTEIKRIHHDMLDRVIHFELQSGSSHSDSASRSLDWTHYKLLSYALKMVVSGEKKPTCFEDPSMKKICKVFVSIIKATFTNGCLFGPPFTLQLFLSPTIQWKNNKHFEHFMSIKSD